MKPRNPLFLLVHGFTVAALALSTLPAMAATEAVSQLAPTTAVTNVGGGQAYEPIVSPDGRFAVFVSTSANLANTAGGLALPEYAPPHMNVFLRDRQTGVTTLVSINAAGTAGGNGDSFASGISSNGHFVVFESKASDLAADDANGVSDVFVRDTVNEITTLVSVNTNGLAGNGASMHATITPDGRYVAFASAASDLVPGDTNGIEDDQSAICSRGLRRGR